MFGRRRRRTRREDPIGSSQDERNATAAAILARIRRESGDDSERNLAAPREPRVIGFGAMLKAAHSQDERILAAYIASNPNDAKARQQYRALMERLARHGNGTTSLAESAGARYARPEISQNNQGRAIAPTPFKAT